MRNIYFISITVIVFIISQSYEPAKLYEHYLVAALFLVGGIFETFNFYLNKAMCFMWAGPIPCNDENKSLRLITVLLWVLIIISCLVFLILGFFNKQL